MTPFATNLRTLLTLCVLALLLAGCEVRSVDAVTDAQLIGEDTATDTRLIDNDAVELPDLQSAQGELQVSPNPIVFGQVKGGEVETQTVSVANVGIAPLTITNISISGSLDFWPEVGARENASFPAPPLEPNSSFELRLVYAPPSLGSDLARLIIDYEV